MKTNPILEELWRIKDELARESGYDIHRFCEQLQAWSSAHPHVAPRVRNAEDLRRLLAESEPKRTEESVVTFNEVSLRNHP
jgi:hypothetical protein